MILFDLQKFPYIMARSWYGYVGAGSIVDPENYLRISVTPTCFSGNEICVAYVFGNTLFPAAFSENIRQYLIDANAAGTSPRPVSPGAKYYVYKHS